MPKQDQRKTHLDQDTGYFLMKRKCQLKETWIVRSTSDGCRFGHPRDEQMPINESQRDLPWVFIIQIQSFPK